MGGRRPHVEMDALALPRLSARCSPAPSASATPSGPRRRGHQRRRVGSPPRPARRSGRPIVAWYDQRGDVDLSPGSSPICRSHRRPLRPGGHRLQARRAAPPRRAAVAGSTSPSGWSARWAATSSPRSASPAAPGCTTCTPARGGLTHSSCSASTNAVPRRPAFGVEGAGQASFAPIAGATLVVAGHDHQVAAFAAGATDPGWLFESLGTADALTVAVPAPVAEATVARRPSTSARRSVAPSLPTG